MTIDVYSPMSRCVETPHKCTKFAREAKIQNTEEITFSSFILKMSQVNLGYFTISRPIYTDMPKSYQMNVLYKFC